MVEHSLGKGEVMGSSPIISSRILLQAGGSNSVVESQPSKLLVAGSIPVSRSRGAVASDRCLMAATSGLARH